MSDEVFHIRSPRPVLWRTPNSLQIGFDDPVITLEDIPDQAAPLIHALQSGVSRQGYTLLAKQLKVTPTAATALVSGLSSAFEEEAPPKRRRLIVTGHSVAREIVAETLDQWGYNVSLATSPPVTRTDVVHVLATDYITDPQWLSRYGAGRSPHLPLVFSDQSVTAGPLTIPGKTPCLSCRELFLRETQPHWLPLGTQLWGQVAPTASEAVARLAGVLVSLALGHLRIAGKSEVKNLIVRFGVTEREISLAEAGFHPACHCQGI
jgi:hypothetical protein